MVFTPNYLAETQIVLHLKTIWWQNFQKEVKNKNRLSTEKERRENFTTIQKSRTLVYAYIQRATQLQGLKRVSVCQDHIFQQQGGKQK